MHKDFVYGKKGHWYRCTDYWNLFDGMGFDERGRLWFIQIKTSNFPSTQPLNLFCQRHPSLHVMAIRVKPEILIRAYPYK